MGGDSRPGTAASLALAFHWAGKGLVSLLFTLQRWGDFIEEF